VTRTQRCLGLLPLLLAASTGCTALHDAVAPPDASLASGYVLTDGAGHLNPAAVQAAAGSPIGFLYEPAYSLDYELRTPARPYVPQPGDLVLATDERIVARVAHLVVHSGAPHHSGIVFALPDGRPALLEGGPDNSWYLRVLDLTHQLEFYASNKRVWVRPRCVSLTPEQSDRLTAFALAAADRQFAEARMVLQGNPITRAKGTVRTRFVGRPVAADFDPASPEAGMRKQYYCSELVTEACVAAGLLPPDTTRPMSMYPRELFFGSSRIPYIQHHLDMSAWLPPSRWSASPGTEPQLRPRPFIDGDSTSIRRTP
jgi:hypothetical protein